MKILSYAPLALAAALGCALPTSNASAQAMEVVTVEAVREVIVGRSATGAPIKELTIRSRVSYADLDLTTAAGSAELEKRVRDTADSTCREIKVDFPVEGWTVDKCVKSAIDGAMEQVNKAVADAKAKGK